MTSYRESEIKRHSLSLRNFVKAIQRGMVAAEMFIKTSNYQPLKTVIFQAGELSLGVTEKNEVLEDVCLCDMRQDEQQYFS